MTRKEIIAKILLELGAVKLNPEKPFIWTSGIESPIYCDNRIITGDPEKWKAVMSLFTRLVADKFEHVEAIAGVATAGITPGAIIAYENKLPFAYVRTEPKKHGLGNQIEGGIEIGKRIVVVEELISTAKSSAKAVEDLRMAGHKVIGLVSIFNYGLETAKNLLAEKDIRHYSLCDLEALSKVAMDGNYIDAKEMQSVLKFAHDPNNWKNNAQILKKQTSA